MKPVIAILGTLNTKEAEGYYLRDRIKAHQGKPLLLDMSMQPYTPKLGKPDISNEEIAEAGCSSMKKIKEMDRVGAQKVMGRGAIKILTERHKAGKLHGIIGYGGSVGLVLYTTVMKELPMFLPKFLLTTLASEAGKQTAGSDITVLWSISDIPGGEKVNLIEAEVFNRAAAAIVAAANPSPPSIERKPVILATQFGNTTPHIIRAKDYLTSIGYDFVAFHAIGREGGYTMERLAESNFAVGVLDVTTHELIDEVAEGVLSASLNGKLRLTAAGIIGIPQVVVPGCVDMVNFWGPETVPEKYRDRLFYEHSRGFITLMRANSEESYAVGNLIAERLNESRGPTLVVFPLRGLSMDDNSPESGTKPQPGVYSQRLKGNLFEPTSIPWWSLEADREVLRGLKEHLDLSKINIDLVVLDYNINEPEFADFCAKMLDDMIKGIWKKGYYSHIDPSKIVKDR